MNYLTLNRNRDILLICILLAVACKLTAQTPAKVIRLKAVTGMQFDKVQLTALPGENIQIVLINQDDMPHNLLITSPGKRQAVVEAALALEEKGPEMNFIPASPDILGSMPVVYPGDSISLVFKTPEKPGAYPYVCSYPGHGFFMYGVLYVGNNLQIPDLEKDTHIPESRRVPLKQAASSVTKHQHSMGDERLHPYDTTPPYLYRAFLEGSGLASIAVRLPGKLAFCWDATACKLQFAWAGDFLDNTDFWHGHKNAYAKVLGEIFYRDGTNYPIRIGHKDAVPTVEYKGYRIVNRYPEFRYIVNGFEVRELIKEQSDGLGLIREFHIPAGIEPVWFVYSGNDGVRYESKTGKFSGNNQISFSPQEAQFFTITMTR